MRKTKILVVDDKPENIVTLANLIAAPDVETLSATSGNDALGLLLGHEFALALLDVQMPGISGFELARLMREADCSRAVPIIFVTASEASRKSVFEGYEQGAVDYLLKPLEPHIVRSKVRVFVELDQKTQALKIERQVLAQKLLEVEGLKAAAEAANRAKSRFLANMSHEIRTPLGAVMGFAELLECGDVTAEERSDNVATIKRNGQLLLRLIDDILDLSKVEADRVEAERIDVALGELLVDLRSVHGLKAAEKGIKLHFTAEGLLPRRIVSDPVRLKQILSNLIGNAVKFTAKGTVEVAVAFTKAAEGSRSQLGFTVRDSGCGMDEAAAARLFQPFMQADSSTKRKFGGTGLGLVIARQLARLLGGDVVLADSEAGSGSVFVVTIDPGPMSEKELVDGRSLVSARLGTGAKGDAPGVCAAPPRLDGLRVLVADDAADNRRLISWLLSRAGATVVMAEDGREAIAEALRGDFDVVLMDIQMPHVDGYEATTTLREQGYRRPIIALTAHAMKEELDRCLAVGCDHFLSKPIDHLELLTMVRTSAERPAH